MKRFVVLLALVVVIGLVFGNVIALDSGYVFIRWHHYSVEATVWSFVALLLVGVIVLQWLLSGVFLLLGSDVRFNDWRRHRREQRARLLTTRGLLNLAQGQWKRAEQQLVDAAKQSDTPLINYLAAARAAYEQGHHDDTDQWLNAANQTTKGSELAVGISQVQLLHSRQQHEQALAVLLRLRQQYPKHPYLLKLLVKTYQDLSDWVALQALLPAIKKFTKVPSDEVKALEDKVNLQVMERIASQFSQQGDAALFVSELQAVYRAMPRNSRYQVGIVRRYVELLLAQSQESEAESALRHALKYVWHDDLIRLYGQIAHVDNKKQWLFAEKQLQERPNDPVLLLVLAKFASRQQETDKAREYLNTALSIKRLPELHFEMAKLMLADGDETLACEHFQLGLALDQK